jgi:hypothetical protein
MTIRLIEYDTVQLYIDQVPSLEHETIIVEVPQQEIDKSLQYNDSKEALRIFLVGYAQSKINDLLTSLKNKPSVYRYRPPMAL